jgi:quercetin dioxygenase-like cupin family protein
MVAEAFDRTWLFTIAPAEWRASGRAEHLATVGPLETKAVDYTAMYVATTFRPGLSSFVHAHPGPEAWFILSGEQCLETPDGPILGRAGEGVAVRGDLPMIVHATGTGIRRNFAVILHDATKAATIRVDDWKPRGLCR